MKHLLSLEKLPRTDIESILEVSAKMKRERGAHKVQPLAGQTWALIFTKIIDAHTRVLRGRHPRTRRQRDVPSSPADSQLGRGEPIQDTAARVMGRMIHGAVIRIFAQRDIEVFAEHAKIPTINALTDDEHPCQILADILTIQEARADSEQGRNFYW